MASTVQGENLRRGFPCLPTDPSGNEDLRHTSVSGPLRIKQGLAPDLCSLSVV